MTTRVSRVPSPTAHQLILGLDDGDRRSVAVDAIAHPVIPTCLHASRTPPSGAAPCWPSRASSGAPQRRHPADTLPDTIPSSLRKRPASHVVYAERSLTTTSTAAWSMLAAPHRSIVRGAVPSRLGPGRHPPAPGRRLHLARPSTACTSAADSALLRRIYSE